MSRFGTFIASVAAAYPSTGDATIDPTWLIGADKISAHHNWNRIVAYTLSATRRGHHEGAVDRVDTVVCTRVLDVVLSVWAPTFDVCENMIHALHVALDDVAGESDVTIADISEAWLPPIGVLTDGGCVADLRFKLAINVLASDTLVITAGADPGDGVPVTAATSLVLSGEFEDTSIPDLVLPYPEV